jgi:membrane protein implicated in regulation of membrane protease activity
VASGTVGSFVTAVALWLLPFTPLRIAVTLVAVILIGAIALAAGRKAIRSAADTTRRSAESLKRDKDILTRSHT